MSQDFDDFRNITRLLFTGGMNHFIYFFSPPQAL